MSGDDSNDSAELLRERLGSKREILEALTELDNVLSEDAELALKIIQEDDQD